MPIGHHVSWSGDIQTTLDETRNVPVIQFYRGARMTKQKPDTDLSVVAIGQKAEEQGRKVYVHATTCYNPAQPTSKSVGFLEWHSNFVKDVHFSHLFGATCVVHCGSARGSDGQASGGIAQAIVNLNSVPTDMLVNRAGRRSVVIENSAGEGAKLGSDWQDLYTFGQGLHPYYGLCIDTQHAWGSGLCDWQSVQSVDSFFTNLDSCIPQRLTMFHLNDSQVEFAAKADRHACIGQKIWASEGAKSGLCQLIKRATEMKIDLILETATNNPLVAIQETTLLDYAQRPDTWRKYGLMP